MDIISDIKRYRLLFGFSIVTLFLSMVVNLFGVVDTRFLYDGNSGTESLFGNQIVCGGTSQGGFLLITWDYFGENRQLETCDTEKLEAYESSFNLIGRLYGMFYKFTENIFQIRPSVFIHLAQAFSALLTAATLSMFVLWSRRKYGSVVSFTVLLLMALSPQLIANSATMISHYNFMSFVLLIFTLYFYKTNMNGKRSVGFWLGLTALFCLKALTSYEYLPTYSLMIGAVIGYELWLHRAPIGVYVKEALRVLGVSVAGLLLALAIHVGVLAKVGGSVEYGITSIRDKVAFRTSAETGINPYWAMKTNSPAFYEVMDSYFNMEAISGSREHGVSSMSTKIKDRVISAMTYMLLPVVSIPIALKEPFATYLQSFGAFILLLLLLWTTRGSWMKEVSKRRKLGALYVALAISFIGYLSWQILARNHSIIHPHLNGFTMYIPFALFGYVVIGLFIEHLINKFAPSVLKKED